MCNIDMAVKKESSAPDTKQSDLTSLFVKTGMYLTAHIPCIMTYASLLVFGATAGGAFHDALHTPLGYAFALSQPPLIEKGVSLLPRALNAFAENKKDTKLGRGAQWFADKLDCPDHTETNKDQSWWERQKSFLWERRKAIAIGYLVVAGLFAADYALNAHAEDGHDHHHDHNHDHHALVIEQPSL